LNFVTSCFELHPALVLSYRVEMDEMTKGHRRKTMVGHTGKYVADCIGAVGTDPKTETKKIALFA